GRKPGAGRVLAALTLLATIVLSIPVASATAADAGPGRGTASWPQFHDTPDHNGYNDTEHTITTASVSRLGLAWQATTGDSITSSATVVNGVVYISSYDKKAYAFDADTGVKLWSFATGASIRASSPVVSGGVVYVGSDDDKVYALDADTGVKLWSYQTGGFIRSAPTVANGVVYVGSKDGLVYALDAGTGRPVWTTDLQG